VDLLQPVDPELPPTAIDVQGWTTTAEVMQTTGAIKEEVDVETLVTSPEAQAVADKAYEKVDELKQQAEQDAEAYQGGS
jgi:D-ribose pyranose/furanose isomerase RbsD